MLPPIDKVLEALESDVSGSFQFHTKGLGVLVLIGALGGSALIGTIIGYVASYYFNEQKAMYHNVELTDPKPDEDPAKEAADEAVPPAEPDKAIIKQPAIPTPGVKAKTPHRPPQDVPQHGTSVQ